MPQAEVVTVAVALGAVTASVVVRAVDVVVPVRDGAVSVPRGEVVVGLVAPAA
jgi:hypothetical protein